MSLTVKSLNGDTAFLLTFSPPVAPLSSPGLFPGSFTILIDPWLVGPSIILNSIFSISHQKAQPCISHLKELEYEPDLILISQDKPDHCHEETLRQLPPDCESTILATPPAAKKIRSWKHYRPELVHALPPNTQGLMWRGHNSMDAREEGRLKVASCHWHHVSTALYSALGY
jgi:hypothetical protein